jgi:hypothetical protein
MDAPDDQPIEPIDSMMLYPSAVATYFAPSDLSGMGGMYSEHIHATPNWRKKGPHYDTVFVNTNLNEHVMSLMRILACGLWNPKYMMVGWWPITDIIHLDTIVCSTHLVAVYVNNHLPKDIPLCYTLDHFHSYSINKYIDHHAFELTF